MKTRYETAGELASAQEKRFEAFVKRNPDNSYAECVWLFYGLINEANIAHQIRQILAVAYDIKERPPSP